MMDTIQKALQFLTELDISAQVFQGEVLLVDRTSMVQFMGRTLNTKLHRLLVTEDKAYETVLNALRGEFPDYHLYWGGRTDDWLGVDFIAKRKVG